MFCPECKVEYESWMKECADCLVPLVETLPPEKSPDMRELVTVFATGSPALLAIAKSILAQAGILYLAKGEGLQDLFAAGSIGGYNPALGPVEIQVSAEHEHEARTLLQELQGDDGLGLDEEETEEDP
ncbi:MAG: DUF2007 domain-containing protein [bacterium]